MRGKIPILEGKHFNFLTVLWREGSLGKRATWRCRCLCGQETVIPTTQLLTGMKKSCGRGHNYRSLMLLVAAEEYRIWNGMLARCRYKNSTSTRYQGRGIKVCKRWQDFSQFLSDVGPRPSPKHSLDRYPKRDGNYEPGNVRWATYTEQARNTDQCIHIEIDGKLRLLVEVTQELGLSRQMIRRRLLRGWSVGDALTQPAKSRNPKNSSCQP